MHELWPVAVILGNLPDNDGILAQLPSTSITGPAAATQRRGVAVWSLRVLLWALSVLIFALALLYGAVRFYVLPSVDRWRPNVEAALERLIERPIRIGRLSAAMEGLRPSLTVHELRLGTPETPPLQIDSVTAVLSLRALLAGRIDLFSLELVHPQFVVERLTERRLRIAGALLDLDASAADADLAILLAPRRLAVRQAQIDWVDQVSGSRARLSEIELAISHHAAAYQAELRVPAISQAFRGLVLRTAFVLDPDTPSDWRRWEGESEISAAHVDFAALDALTRSILGAKAAPALRLAAGGGEVSFSARFAAGRVDDLLVKAKAEALAVNVSGKELPLRSLALEALARRESEGFFAVQLRKLQVSDGAGLALALRGVNQHVVFDAQRLSPISGELAFAEFDAGSLLNALRRLPLPAAWLADLTAITASGRIAQASVQWRADTHAPRFSAEMSFDRLAMRRAAQRLRPGQLQWPAFSGLSGRVVFDERAGRIEINTNNAVLRFPGVFADPALTLDSLEAALAWQRADSSSADLQGPVEVGIEHFRFANADMAGTIRGSYRSGGRGAGLVDISGQLDRANAARVARYLPLVIGPAVRAWVGRAVQAGRSSDTRFVLRGDLFDFPFRQPDSGEFRIESRLIDATLAYAPGWPVIRQIQGALVFERAGMDITARSAQVFGVRLGETRARIVDFGDPLLSIEGDGAGPAQDMIRFINESPLKAKVDDFAQGARLAGDAQLSLQLQMPLTRPETAKVKGTVQLAGNEVSVHESLPPFNKLRGRLEFTEADLRLRDIQAEFLGGPLQLQGESVSAGRYRLTAQGGMAASALSTQWVHPLMQAISGEAAYQAQIDIESGKIRLALQSDLVGLVSGLPPPFGKTASARWPLRLQTRSHRLAGRAGLHHEVQLRNDVKAVVEHAIEGADSSAGPMVRGSLAINAEPDLPSEGFSLRMHLPGLELDPWSALLAERVGSADTPAAGSARSPWAPRSISLAAQELQFGGKTLRQVDVSADYRDGAWRGLIKSDEMDGRFTWRDAAAGQDSGSLEAAFKRLEIPRSQAEEVEALFVDRAPSGLPAISLSAERFVLFGRDLGRLSLRAINEGSGQAQRWRLEQLDLDHPGGAIRASGHWGRQADATFRSTELSFALKLTEPARWLNSFGIRDAITGGSGQIDGRLQWVGSPLALDYPSLAGELHMSLGKGQFLKTEPGIAKLIGVLNLQSLPRRLTLDFRDVFADGFAFDEIRGKARIDGGVAITEDLRMRGVQAQVAIRGEANIAAETQQLSVTVKPELNAGLASLAYAAVANPMIGFGSFLAQLAFRKPLQDLFTYVYEVLGTWADPTVIERARPRFDQIRDQLSSP